MNTLDRPEDTEGQFPGLHALARVPPRADPVTGTTVISVLAELDQARAQLQKEFPGWRIWYVYHPDAITWAAQREPVLNTPSAEDLRAAIQRALARNDNDDLEVLEDRIPLASDRWDYDDTQDTTDTLTVIAGKGSEHD